LDLVWFVDDLEGELYRAFKKPRVPGFNVLLELQTLAQTLPDIVDRWWMVVYSLAAEPAASVTNWRVISWAGLLQHAFGLADQDMDLAAADASIFPASLPRPA
jgi:hypothetical protein